MIKKKSGFLVLLRKNESKFRKGYHQATWSAEPQENLTGKEIQNALEKSLQNKTVWPWPSTSEHGFEEKRELLKKAGFKEWKNKGANQKWLLTNQLAEAETGLHQ